MSLAKLIMHDTGFFGERLLKKVNGLITIKFCYQKNTISFGSQGVGRVLHICLTPSFKIFVDGPFGSPSSNIYRAEHAGTTNKESIFGTSS